MFYVRTNLYYKYKRERYEQFTKYSQISINLLIFMLVGRSSQTQFDPFANMIITNTAFTIQLVIVSTKETYLYSETFTQWGKLTSEGIVYILFRIKQNLFDIFSMNKNDRISNMPSNKL